MGESLLFEGCNLSPIIYPGGSGPYVRFEQVGKGGEVDTEIARVLTAQVVAVRAASGVSGSVE